MIAKVNAEEVLFTDWQFVEDEDAVAAMEVQSHLCRKAQVTTYARDLI